MNCITVAIVWFFTYKFTEVCMTYVQAETVTSCESLSSLTGSRRSLDVDLPHLRGIQAAQRTLSLRWVNHLGQFIFLTLIFIHNRYLFRVEHV